MGDATAPASPGFNARRCIPRPGHECDFAAVNCRIRGRGAAERIPAQRRAAQRSTEGPEQREARKGRCSAWCMVRMACSRGMHGEWKKTVVAKQAVRRKNGAVARRRRLTWSRRGRVCRRSSRSWLLPPPPAPGWSAGRQHRARCARLLRAGSAQAYGMITPHGSLPRRPCHAMPPYHSAPSLRKLALRCSWGYCLTPLVCLRGTLSTVRANLIGGCPVCELIAAPRPLRYGCRQTSRGAQATRSQSPTSKVYFCLKGGAAGAARRNAAEWGRV